MIRLACLILLVVYIYRSLKDLKKAFAENQNAKKENPSKLTVPKKVIA